MNYLPMQYAIIRVQLSLFSHPEYLLHPISPEAAGQINEVLSCPSAVNNAQGRRTPHFIRPPNATERYQEVFWGKTAELAAETYVALLHLDQKETEQF
ncbi:hypothetical protein CDAR_572131 [Caerostris darwini]|uniref:Uncharacterized protein n=1 Tax=Caerostris darwini TaxID=1538125 RepID=A0AAV4RAK3_9ARAC|nr:hypothetical protein CDAR_572131 [Caerostris darwini]